MGTIVVAGMGPLLGLGIAKRFGREGYKVAMIGRKAERLRGYEELLEDLGIEATGFPADLANPSEVEQAFAGIRARFGEVDILEFSPTNWNKGGYESTQALATTVESAKFDFDLLVLGAISCARQVIPSMIERGDGGIFFSTGYSAIQPIPFITSLCISNAGLRSYAHCLHEELKPKGVYVGTVSINAFIADNTAADPVTIADIYWDMFLKRDRIESVFGPV